MKKLITYLLLMVMTVVMTACPEKSIANARKRSAQVASYANTGVNLTRDLFNAKLITLEQKDQVAVGFIALAQAGKTFDEAVRSVETTYGVDVPRAEVEKLFEVFNSLVVGKFLDVLRTLKLIPSDSRIGEVIELIRTAVLSVAKAFGKSYEVRQQLEAV